MISVSGLKGVVVIVISVSMVMITLVIFVVISSSIMVIGSNLVGVDDDL